MQPQPQPLSGPNGVSVSKMSVPYDSCADEGQCCVPFPSPALSAPRAMVGPTSGNGKDAITDGERLWAKELNALPSNERESIFEDIHGVKETIEETPDFVDDNMVQLEHEIDLIRKKDAYLKAGFLSPRAVRDRTLRLKVLRTSRWDPKAAAKLLTKYFETKLTLFGEERLVRPIVWDDLQLDAKASLMSGAIMRHHECTDTSGRSILIMNMCKFYFTSALSWVQSIWYMNAYAPNHVHATQKGIVAVINTAGTTMAQLYGIIGMAQQIGKLKINDSVPVRIASHHICFESHQLKPVLSMLILTLPDKLRIRTKFHIGSHLEILYELSSFGIPPGLLPFDVNGNANVQVINSYIASTRQRETAVVNEYTSKKPAHCLFVPRPNDVVLGRGWPYQSYQGNIKLVEFLERYKNRYVHAGSKSEKTMITASLVTTVRVAGVRFLQRDESGEYWVEVNDDIARQKIAMTLRNLARK